MPGSDATDQSQAVEILNPSGSGPVLLLCEHASYDIPARYGGLGLGAEARISHAAWDIGARAMGLHLSSALDAPFVTSRVSRLVYDCNRPPDAPGAMIETSEQFDIPGNRNLSEEDRSERIATVYRPFCDAVTGVIEARKAKGQATILVTIHSFTPVYFGKTRAVEIGILHDSDARVADIMLGQAHLLPHRQIDRNEPYSAADGVTHSLQLHGIAHGLANVMIEVRNDLLGNPEDEARMAGELLKLLDPALDVILSEDAARA